MDSSIEILNVGLAAYQVLGGVMTKYLEQLRLNRIKKLKIELNNLAIDISCAALKLESLRAQEQELVQEFTALEDE